MLRFRCKTAVMLVTVLAGGICFSSPSVVRKTAAYVPLGPEDLQRVHGAGGALP